MVQQLLLGVVLKACIMVCVSINMSRYAHTGIIVSYLVEVVETELQGTDFSVSRTVNTNSLSISLPSCCAGFNYRVTARTLAGLGQRSQYVDFRTPASQTRKQTPIPMEFS